MQKPFRPIHYLGSKLRFLDFIENTVDMVDPSRGCICDLFAGSGTVSAYLAQRRKVISVDIQEYSRVICTALLRPALNNYKTSTFINHCKTSKHYETLQWCFEPMIYYELESIKQAYAGNYFPLCELIESGSVISYEQGFISNCSTELLNALEETVKRLQQYNLLTNSGALVGRYFGGLYFSYLQSIQMDSLLEQISKLPKDAKDTYLAATLSTASDIVNTVGKQFAQPIKPRNASGKPKISLVKKILNDRNHNVFTNYEVWLERYLTQEIPKSDHVSYKMDYVDALNSFNHSVKVVYADPPYTRYHYSRYYHVLETICLRDNPTVSKTFANGKISRGVYRSDRHQSPFCIKSKAPKAFDVLFDKVSELGASLVLSYSPYDKASKSTPRLLSIEQLGLMANRYFKQVEIISAGQFSHSKLNHSDKNFKASEQAELLIVCKK
ncbi:MAG: DNA adenine methylase [Clostridiales bacterium]|jgi:adenine-specific DNA methylase|nr:DNA adenine methylase [Clostridiales bacterium]